jgi:hypothetical protein
MVWCLDSGTLELTLRVELPLASPWILDKAC